MSFETTLHTGLICALAVLIALHDRRGRGSPTLVGYLLFLALVNVLYGLWLVPALDGAARPFEGYLRAIYHLRQVLYLGVAIGFSWPCGVLFDARPTRLAACIVMPLTALALIVGYPDIRTSFVYTLASSAALLANWYAIFTAALVGNEVRPRLTHLVTMILVGADSVVVLYGFANRIAPGFASAWDALNLVTAVAYCACIALYLAAILRRAQWSVFSSSSS